MTACLTVCRRSRVTRHHASTATHRANLRRRDPAIPRGRPAWMTGLRDWTSQYDDRDPGNSAAWDAAYAAAGGAR